MSKRIRKNSPIFGAFLIVSGVVVIAAVAYVSQSGSQSDSQSDSSISGEENFNAEQASQANSNGDSSLVAPILGTGGSGGVDAEDDINANTNDATSDAVIDDSNDDSNSNSNNNNNNDSGEESDNTNPSTQTIGDGAELLQSASQTNYGEITAFTFQDQDTLNIMPLSYQSTVLNELGVTNQTEVTIAGQSAIQYNVISAKDGSEQTVIQVEYQGTLYDFRGSDEFLQNLSEYIQFGN